MTWRSYGLSVLIIVALAVWMASGMVARNERAAESDASGASRDPMRVQVRRQTAETVARELATQGEARPDRRVSLRAETEGRVTEIMAAKGASVSEGDGLIRLAMNTRESRLDEAKAAVAQRQTEYQAAQRLEKEGFQSRTRIREAFAALQAARAELAAIREDIDNTVIRAPFDGVVNERPVEVGDYLRPGDTAAELVSNDPLRVVINVAQQDVGELRRGATAEVSLATGQEITGEVAFIAASADSRTRTFRADVLAPNPEGLPSGVSASVRIPLGDIRAHFVSPAVLALDAEGELGAKTVTRNNEVVFHRVEIVRSERDGVWVTGLPERARLITVGQAFVRDGDTVDPVRAEDSPIKLETAPERALPLSAREQ